MEAPVLIFENVPLQWWDPWGVGLAVLAIIALVVLVIWILVCIWVYRDAESRGMSGVLWLLIVLFTSILGLIIYLVVREDRKTRQVQMPPPPGYPPHGYPPPQQTYQRPPPGSGANFCQNCGAPLQPETKFCSNCGQRI